MRKLYQEGLKAHWRYDSSLGGLMGHQWHSLPPKTELRVPSPEFVVQKQALIFCTNCKSGPHYTGSSVSQGSCWATLPLADSRNAKVGRHEGLQMQCKCKSWDSHISDEVAGASCVCIFLLCFSKNLLICHAHIQVHIYTYIHTLPFYY